MFKNSNFSFILQKPSFANGITARMVKKLTPLEEGQLREFSTRARSDFLDRLQRVNQQVSENIKTTDSDVLSFTVCSTCGFTLIAIKKGTLSRLLSGSIISGFICNNKKCSFYLKFIPVNKYADLTKINFFNELP